MKPISISENIEMLREEIGRIFHKEQLYRQAAHRSVMDEMDHDARELRLMEIREELAGLRGRDRLGQDQYN
jgi:hypothetical protein